MNPSHPRSSSGVWRGLGRLMLFVVIAVALVAAALGVAIWDGLSHWGGAGQGVSVTVNGEDVLRAWDISDWSTGHKLVLVAVATVALLAALLALPMALLAGAVALVFVMLGTVAMPLLIGLLVVAIVLSPLWLLVWWLVARSRRGRADRGQGSAPHTIDA